MPDGLNPMWVGIFLAGGVAAYFLLPPLLILFTQKMEASPEIVEYQPHLVTPPGSAARFFDDSEYGLKACGFRRISSVVLPNPMPNVMSVLELFVHDHNRDTALVIAIFGITPEAPPLHTRYVEFVSEFSDHELKMLVTNNGDEVGAFPDRRESPTFRLPQLDDVEPLYHVHQQLVERHARGARKQLSVFEDFDGNVAHFLKTKVLLESYKWQEAIGILRYDSNIDCFVPTFPGAYRMTWRLLWPVKQMIQARYASNGRRLAAKFLDADDWDDEF